MLISIFHPSSFLKRCCRRPVSSSSRDVWRVTVWWDCTFAGNVALSWNCYNLQPNTTCLSVCLCVCLHSLDVLKETVPLLLFTFSHSQGPPLSGTPTLQPTVCSWSLYNQPCCSLCACRWDCHGYYHHGYCDLIVNYKEGVNHRVKMGSVTQKSQMNLW